MRRQNRVQLFNGVDFLLGMRDTEQFIEFRFKTYLATPPVVVVFFALLSHEEPSSVNLAPSPYNRNPGVLCDASRIFFLVRERVPQADREFGEANSYH